MKLPPAWKPHQAVILGIDSAAQSGWAIWRPGALRVGVIRNRVGAEAERCLVVEDAIAEARTHGLSLIVLGEKWTAGGAVRDGKMHASTLLGLGAAWRDWERVLRHYKVPKKRIARTNVKTWQGAMLKGLGARTSAELKRASRLVALSRFPGLPSDFAPDAYDAGCLALWGSQSGEVGHILTSSRAWPRLTTEPLVCVGQVL